MLHRLIHGRSVRALFVALSLATTAAPALAEIPATIAYEGFLRGAADQPVDGPVDLTFRLYAQPVGGDASWTESHDDVAVSSGVFSVSLGSSTPFASAGVAFDRPLFLGITVNGETLNSRVAFQASPYSLATRVLDATVDVDCGAGASLADALAGAPDATRLVVDISGICTGNVSIMRDHVTLQTRDGSGVIRGVSPSGDAANATLWVPSARGVVLDGIAVEGPGGDTTGMRGLLIADNASVMLIGGAQVRGHAGHGVLVVESSNVDLFSSTVSGNAGAGIVADSGSHVDLIGSDVSSSGAEGILMLLGSSLDLGNSTVSGNATHGVVVREGSAARIRDGSTIASNGVPGGANYHVGLFVDEGSTARVIASTVSTETHDGSDGAAVAVFRHSNLRILGGSTISAPHVATVICPAACTGGVPYGAGGGGMAIDAEVHSAVRLDGGKSTVVGNIYTYNLSTVDLRDMEQTGNFVASDGLDANVRLRDQSPEDGTATVTGTVVFGYGPTTIRTDSSPERAIVDGAVLCLGRSAPGGIVFLGGVANYVDCGF